MARKKVDPELPTEPMVDEALPPTEQEDLLPMEEPIPISIPISDELPDDENAMYDSPSTILEEHSPPHVPSDISPAEDEVPPRESAISDFRAFMDLDFRELDRGLTSKEHAEWEAIYASYRGKSMMTGTIVGVDDMTIERRSKRTGKVIRETMSCVIVVPLRVRILIPESQMWFDASNAPPDYAIRSMIGAKIEFVVTKVDREAQFAIASRKMALQNRRRYFRMIMDEDGIDRNRKFRCTMLVVGPRRCLVECAGYDIGLTQRELRYAAIPDLRTEYESGMRLPCIIKNYDKDEDCIEISVKETEPNPFIGADERHPVGCKRLGVIAGKFAGGTFCNLYDNVVVQCLYSYQYEDSDFKMNDQVVVRIMKYDYNRQQIYGRIVPKR